MSQISRVPSSTGGYFMSPEDQRDLKGRILVEYQEVEDAVNSLAVALRRMGTEMNSFGVLLMTTPT
jgi:hypothetical protein